MPRRRVTAPTFRRAFSLARHLRSRTRCARWRCTGSTASSRNWTRPLPRSTRKAGTCYSPTALVMATTSCCSPPLIAKRAVVIGASLIGLEVASSLRARHVDLHVVASDTIPMEKVLGADVGNFIRKLQQQHGVTFHLGSTAVAIDRQSVRLKNGESLQADLVVIGIGVQPRVALAEPAGLAVDRRVTVDDCLESSVARIFAAGDIARWPDRLTGERIRVEHWVLAERQGQTAARNMLGARERFDAVPFFWSE